MYIISDNAKDIAEVNTHKAMLNFKTKEMIIKSEKYQ